MDMRVEDVKALTNSLGDRGSIRADLVGIVIKRLEGDIAGLKTDNAKLREIVSGKKAPTTEIPTTK